MNVRITDIDGKKPTFTQWDVDRVLYIEGCESQPCLHFANPMLIRAMVVQAEADGSRWVCRVPNWILQWAEPMVVSVFIQPDEGKTVLTEWYRVAGKTKPQDYTYEENIGYVNWVAMTEELEQQLGQIQDMIDDSIAKAIREGDFSGVFWATYGETPLADIIAAHNESKAVLLQLDANVLYLANCSAGGAKFTCNKSITTYYADVSPGGAWTGGSYWLVTDSMLMAITGEPSSLQTTAKTNLVAAINELHQQIASLTNASGVSF